MTEPTLKVTCGAEAPLPRGKQRRSLLSKLHAALERRYLEVESGSGGSGGGGGGGFYPRS